MIWFDRLRTIAFEPSTMREHLFFGRLVLEWDEDTQQEKLVRDVTDRSSFCLAEWLMFVPKPFLARAEGAGIKVVREMMSGGMKVPATDVGIQIFISFFQKELHDAYCKADLTDQGWGYDVEHQDGRTGWSPGSMRD